MAGNSGRVDIVIQERDRHLLSEIGLLGDIDRETASVIGPFGSATQAKQRLLELTRAGFLSRYFVGTISGGRKAIYRLSPKGSALLGIPTTPPARKPRDHIAKDLFLDHRLKTNSIFLKVKYLPIPIASVRFCSWRSFVSPLSKAIGLIPDAYFEVESSAGVRCMFLEVDLGTEVLQVWERKVRRYLQLATSGQFAEVFQQIQFRVLVVTDSARRLENIRAVVSKSIDRVFWFTTFELINREGFWSSIWLRPVGEEKQPLIGNLP